jgi:hypothetical protein
MEQKSLLLSEYRLPKRGMILWILFSITVLSCPVLGSVTITYHNYALMNYTKLISEENFTDGRPLVIVLPLAGDGTTNEEVGYLIENLHISGRWPILVFRDRHNKWKNMYTEIKQDGSYIIMASAPCVELELYIRSFLKKPKEIILSVNWNHSWNPRAKFVVPVMPVCLQIDNKNISRTILEQLWLSQVMKAVVLFTNSNKHAGNVLQQNTADSAQGTYLELHTWYPYGNSDSCNPTEGTVLVKVFTVRNLSDIRRSDIFRGHIDKNFNGCPITIIENENPFMGYSTDEYHTIDVREWEVELLRVIGNALNSSLHIVYAGDRIAMEKLNGKIYINLVSISPLHYAFERFTELTRSFLSVRFAWYTPCAVKYERWSRFFNIFSVDMWICFAFSLILAVITVRCISNYGHKSHLHQSKSDSNIFSVTSNIISALLSVAVNT